MALTAADISLNYILEIEMPHNARAIYKHPREMPEPRSAVVPCVLAAAATDP